MNFKKHNEEKDKKRMLDYHDPKYREEMRFLLMNANPPKRDKRVRRKEN